MTKYRSGLAKSIFRRDAAVAATAGTNDAPKAAAARSYSPTKTTAEERAVANRRRRKARRLHRQRTR